MHDRSDPQRSATLTLPSEEHWTLHHVLLDRIEREPSAEEPTDAEPPAIEVYRAFERLDAGSTTFTLEQLEAMQTVLADYHHRTTWWEIERPRVESLLRRITDRIEELRSVAPAE